LLDAGIPLQSLDYSIPADNSPLPSSGEIRVFKVQERFLLEAEPLPFETETRPAADVEIDNQQIVQPGVYGLLARRIRLLLVDGEEITRQVEAEYIAQEPQAEIMGYGTKIVPHTMNTPDGEITYWRALNMYAVSYKPSSAGDNITATGAVLQKGIVAIDPDYILYGTQMYIPGYGFGVAADTGGGVVGRLIDLGYTDADYISWHQWVTVYFLWPPPGFVAWVIP
jgi:3D (Asp-Asp-Asp) domain-containing protein